MPSDTNIAEMPASLLRAWFLARDPVVQLHVAMGAQHLFVNNSLGEKLTDLDKALHVLVARPLDPETEVQTVAFMKAFAEALEPLSSAEKWKEFGNARPNRAPDAQDAYARKSFEATQRSFIDAATSFSSVVASFSRAGRRLS